MNPETLEKQCKHSPLRVTGQAAAAAATCCCAAGVLLTLNPAAACHNTAGHACWSAAVHPPAPPWQPHLAMHCRDALGCNTCSLPLCHALRQALGCNTCSLQPAVHCRKALGCNTCSLENRSTPPRRRGLVLGRQAQLAAGPPLLAPRGRLRAQLVCLGLCLLRQQAVPVHLHLGERLGSS